MRADRQYVGKIAIVLTRALIDVPRPPRSAWGQGVSVRREGVLSGKRGVGAELSRSSDGREFIARTSAKPRVPAYAPTSKGSSFAMPGLSARIREISIRKPGTRRRIENKGTSSTAVLVGPHAYRKHLEMAGPVYRGGERRNMRVVGTISLPS